MIFHSYVKLPEGTQYIQMPPAMASSLALRAPEVKGLTPLGAIPLRDRRKLKQRGHLGSGAGVLAERWGDPNTRELWSLL